MIKKLLILIFLFPLDIFAQERPAMADGLRSEGKIYVVITVIAIVFVSLALLMIYLDRKISKLERRLNGKT